MTDKTAPTRDDAVAKYKLFADKWTSLLTDEASKVFRAELTNLFKTVSDYVRSDAGSHAPTTEGSTPLSERITVDVGLLVEAARVVTENAIRPHQNTHVILRVNDMNDLMAAIDNLAGDAQVGDAKAPA